MPNLHCIFELTLKKMLLKDRFNRKKIGRDIWANVEIHSEYLQSGILLKRIDENYRMASESRFNEYTPSKPLIALGRFSFFEVK